MSEQVNTNLFQVLQRGDRLISSSHQTAIILVGLTRAGKSTTFNWILGRPMVGKGDEVSAYYETVVTDLTTAELGNTFTSVTLCPNVVEFDRDNKITVMDMAGYKDKRNYIGVLGVSYFLKAVFERVRRVKFLIVIDEEKLVENSGDGVIGTFTGFLNMFNLADLAAQERENFYSSISLVVTRSERPTKHQYFLKRILSMLGDNRLILENKQEVVRLIKKISDSNRIEPFPVAVANQNPPKCDFFSRFDDALDWKYLDLSAVEKKTKKDLIAVPFRKDYEELSASQQKQFNQCIQARVKSYVQFSTIIGTLIRSINQKWASALETYRVTKQTEVDLGRCELLFDEVSAFLMENDLYSSENLVPRQVITDLKLLTFTGVIKQILRIYDVADLISDQSDTNFIGNMLIYSNLFGQLIDCLTPFATNSEQVHLLRRLDFIIKRGFREFSKLYQLNPDVIHDVNQKMKDNTNERISVQTRQQFIEGFITPIEAPRMLFPKLEDQVEQEDVEVPLMLRLFPNLGYLLEYEDFFNNYQSQFSLSHDSIYFTRRRYGLEAAKALLYIRSYKNDKALHCYIRAYRCQSDIAYSASHSYDQQQQAENEKNLIHMVKLSLIGNINALLKIKKEVPEARNIALALSKQVKDIHQTCRIYELLIDDASAESKGDLLNQYADYCLQWGRLQQANSILQRKLSLQRTNFSNYMDTIKKLSLLIQEKKKHFQKYAENLSVWSRLPEYDPTIDNYFSELEILIPDVLQ